MYIFENVYLYWIYAANNLGSMCQLNIYVGIGYRYLNFALLVNMEKVLYIHKCGANIG